MLCHHLSVGVDVGVAGETDHDELNSPTPSLKLPSFTNSLTENNTTPSSHCILPV